MTLPLAEKPARDSGAMSPSVALLLASGGDERIALDPATRRNRYGATVTPRRGEVFLSSSTASTITPRAYRAVETAWATLAGDRGRRAEQVDAWFDSLRARIGALFGTAGGAVVLAGSGTEAELIALAVAKSIAPGPLTNIVLAPAETGSGVLRAAGGAHFLASTPFGGERAVGERLAGWSDEDIEVAAVEIRDFRGQLRALDAVDAEARRLAYAAIDGGRAVLLHRLDSSKTGQSGLAGVVASQIMASAPARIVVLVDCCQLRCSRRRIRRYLAQGFMVAITGSKFFGGPPFSGALLLPPRILRRIGRLDLPAGLLAFSSRLDWPASLRDRNEAPWINEANLGLGLRWIAALDEMERFYANPAVLRRAILEFFEQNIIKHAQSVDNLFLVDSDCRKSDGEARSILSFTMSHPDGEAYSLADAAAVHARLRAADPASSTGFAGDRAWHLGQPVVLGPRTALRVCASAPMVSEIVARVVAGEALERAFAQWDRDLETMFGAWAQAMHESSARREASAWVPRRASLAP